MLTTTRSCSHRFEFSFFCCFTFGSIRRRIGSPFGQTRIELRGKKKELKSNRNETRAKALREKKQSQGDRGFDYKLCECIDQFMHRASSLIVNNLSPHNYRTQIHCSGHHTCVAHSRMRFDCWHSAWFVEPAANAIFYTQPSSPNKKKIILCGRPFTAAATPKQPFELTFLFCQRTLNEDFSQGHLIVAATNAAGKWDTLFLFENLSSADAAPRNKIRKLILTHRAE